MIPTEDFEADLLRMQFASRALAEDGLRPKQWGLVNDANPCIAIKRADSSMKYVPIENTNALFNSLKLSGLGGVGVRNLVVDEFGNVTIGSLSSNPSKGTYNVNVSDGLGGWGKTALKVVTSELDHLVHFQYPYSAENGFGIAIECYEDMTKPRIESLADRFTIQSKEEGGTRSELSVGHSVLGLKYRHENGEILQFTAGGFYSTLRVVHPEATADNESATLGQVKNYTPKGLYNVGFGDNTTTDYKYGISGSFNNTTRTYSATHSSGTVTFWSGNTRFSYANGNANLSVQIPNVNGQYILYFNTSGVLSWYNVGNEPVIDIRRKVCMVAVVVWDVTVSAEIITVAERHGCGSDYQLRERLHSTDGSRYSSGLAIADIVAGGNTFSIASGACYDEDTRFETAGFATGTPIIPKNYLDGQDGYGQQRIKRGAINQYIYLKDTDIGLGVTGRIVYNTLSGGFFVPATVSNNKFACYHIFCAQGLLAQISVAIGQAEYQTIADARAGALSEIKNLRTSQALAREAVPLYTVILSHTGAFQTVDSAGNLYVDWRTTNTTTTGGASSTPSLQQVTDVGATTTNDITVGSSKAPSAYGHGGTNKFIEINNGNTASNSQAHCIISTGSVDSSSSIGTLTWAMPNISAIDKKVGFLTMVTTSIHTSANPETELLFGTRGSNDSVPVYRLILKSNGDMLTTAELPINKVMGSGVGVFGNKLVAGDQSSNTDVVSFTYNSQTGENRVGGIQNYVYTTIFGGGIEVFRANANGTGQFANPVTVPNATLSGHATNLGQITSVPLTGFVASSGTIVATDTILEGLQKVSSYGSVGTEYSMPCSDGNKGWYTSNFKMDLNNGSIESIYSSKTFGRFTGLNGVILGGGALIGSTTPIYAYIDVSAVSVMLPNTTIAQVDANSKSIVTKEYLLDKISQPTTHILQSFANNTLNSCDNVTGLLTGKVIFGRFRPATGGKCNKVRVFAGTSYNGTGSEVAIGKTSGANISVLGYGIFDTASGEAVIALNTTATFSATDELWLINYLPTTGSTDGLFSFLPAPSLSNGNARIFRCVDFDGSNKPSQVASYTLVSTANTVSNRVPQMEFYYE